MSGLIINPARFGGGGAPTMPATASWVANWSAANYGLYGSTINMSGSYSVAYRMNYSASGAYGCTPVCINNNFFIQHGFNSNLLRLGWTTSAYWESGLGHALNGANVINKEVYVVVTVDNAEGAYPDPKVYWRFASGPTHYGPTVFTNTNQALPKVNAQIYLGRNYNSAWWTYSAMTTGSLWDVAAWTQVLTAQEISDYLDNLDTYPP